MKTKKINYRFGLIFLSVILVFNFFPLLLLAQAPNPNPPATTEGLVTCGKGDSGPTSCNWQELVKTFNNIIDFIFKDLMIPLAVLALVYAGIKILLGKSKPEDLIKAKGALRNVAIGIFLALGAYAIVKTILSLVSSPGGVLDQVIQQVFG